MDIAELFHWTPLTPLLCVKPPCFYFNATLTWTFCHPELVVTTGRSWSPPPAARSAHPCPTQTAGASLKATRTWCSRKRPPLRISCARCSPSPKPSEECGIWMKEKPDTHLCHQSVGNDEERRDWRRQHLILLLGLFLCLFVYYQKHIVHIAMFFQDHFSIKSIPPVWWL